MKTCPFCAESIADAAVVCPRCTRELPQKGLPFGAVAAIAVGIAMLGLLAVIAVVFAVVTGRG